MVSCTRFFLHELARKFDARNWRKKLMQVSCASFLTVCHHHKRYRLHCLFQPSVHLSACLSFCLSVLYRFLTRKRKGVECRQTKITVNISQGRSNRCASFQLRRSKVRFMVRVNVTKSCTVPCIARRMAAYVGSGPSSMCALLSYWNTQWFGRKFDCQWLIVSAVAFQPFR